MSLQAALVILLMLASTVKADEGGVKFWRKDVILTCPGEATWYDKSGTNITTESKSEYETEFKTEYKQELKVSCKLKNDGNKDYFFYVKGKVCENCFEVDAFFFMMTIIGDVIGTTVLMVIIFKCTKKSSSRGSGSSYKPSVQSAPTIPNRDYEELNRHTRANDTYSTVVNRTG